MEYTSNMIHPHLLPGGRGKLPVKKFLGGGGQWYPPPLNPWGKMSKCQAFFLLSVSKFKIFFLLRLHQNALLSTVEIVRIIISSYYLHLTSYVGILDCFGPSGFTVCAHKIFQKKSVLFNLQLSETHRNARKYVPLILWCLLLCTCCMGNDEACHLPLTFSV